MPVANLKFNSPQVRAAVLSHYLDVVATLGVDPVPLLRSVGLSKKNLATPSQSIPVDRAVSLLELTAKETGCAHLGTLMASARIIADFGPVSLLLLHLANLRQVLHAIVQYRYLINETLSMYVEDLGNTSIIREELMTKTDQGACQATQLAIGTMLQVCRTVLGRTWSPQGVYFAFSAPKHRAPYQELFRCPVYFGSEFNGLSCFSSDLDKPNRYADPVLAGYARAFIESLPKPAESSVLQDVRRSALVLLPMGRASIEEIAQSLGLGVRTLQRHLEQDGTRFDLEICSVRRELCLRHIRDPRLSIAKVAQLLGYTNASSFSRWCLNEFQASPSALRRAKSEGK